MKNKKLFEKLILCISVILVLSLSFLFEQEIYNFANADIAAKEQKFCNSSLQIHYIDVGQGDAFAIKLPDGKRMLIDCGTQDSAQTLVDYLDKNFFDDDKMLDIFLITHPHEDHIGGGVQIFENYQVKTFLRPKVYTPEESNYDYEFTYSTDIFKQVIQASKQEENCSTEFLDMLSPSTYGNDYSIKYLVGYGKVQSANNACPLILLECQGFKFAFAGDIEDDLEESLLLYFAEDLTDIDVLKVGHHGSTTSSSTQFVTALSPKYSVISVGRYNEYSHPTDTVLERLQQIDSTIYRTDNNGNICVGIADEQLVFVYDYQNRMPIRIQVWQLVLIGAVAGIYVVLVTEIQPDKPILDARIKK